jgi:hypothetical protein
MLVIASNPDPDTVMVSVSTSTTATFVISKLVIDGGVAITLHPDAVYASMYPVSVL